jgi:hypothetical protein
MTTHIWNGHKIDVECYAVPKLFWMAASLSVCIDGVLAGCSPDSLELRTKVPFRISDDGVMRDGCVVSGHPFSVLRAPYRVLLEEKQIASGVVRARNWYVTYGILLAGAIVLVFLLYFIHVHNHVV